MPDGAGVPIRCYTVSVFAIARNAGSPKLLLMRRADTLAGCWCQVAGKIEKDETAWQAALRELREETGLVAETLYHADIFERFYEPEKDVITIVPVFVTSFEEIPDISLNDEHDAFRWVSFDEGMDLVSFSGQRRVLTEIKSDFVDRTPDPHHLIELKRP